MKNPVSYLKQTIRIGLLLLSQVVDRYISEPCAHLLRSRSQRQTLHGVERLARAVEYLEGTRPYGAEVTPRMVAIEQSIAILKACHRNAFFSCGSEGQLRAARAFR